MARATTRSQRLILLVEDDEDTRVALEILLTDEGYSVRGVSSASDALTELVREDPGLVLLDWTLPDGTGEAVLLAAKAGASSRFVVLMTGSSLAGVRARQADAVLRKPFGMAELLATVSRFA